MKTIKRQAKTDGKGGVENRMRPTTKKGRKGREGRRNRRRRRRKRR